MSQLTVFDFDSTSITVLTDDDGEPWFVAKEVCEVLGLSKYRDAIARLDDDEKSTRPLQLDGWSQAREIAVLSEPGLYALIQSSRKEEAKPFQRWVNHTVLPVIRRTGLPLKQVFQVTVKVTAVQNPPKPPRPTCSPLVGASPCQPHRDLCDSTITYT